MTVNELIQTAAEDLSLTGDGETVTPELAASCEGLLNRAIADLNADNYMSLSVKKHDVIMAGSVYFRELEPDETASNTIDQAPPDSIQGVARKVGIRWLPLRATNPQSMDRCQTFSLPQMWSYSVSSEVSPSGKTRQVGIVALNGTTPVDLRIYENSQFPKYKLGDTIYLSDLYHNLILYALEMKMVNKYKLESYRQQTQIELTKAQQAIDTMTARNRPLTNELGATGSYLDCYYDLLGGTGF